MGAQSVNAMTHISHGGIDRAIDDAERLTGRELKRYWKRVDVSDGDGCWLWLGSRFPRGYGSYCFRRKRIRATRIALLLDGRPMPKDGLRALHSCDNPACVNPKHLRWGTDLENAADRKLRGRDNTASGPRHRTRTKPHLILRGEGHGCAKLTADDVIEIRRDIRMQREIAATYGVSRSLIGQIRTGKLWSHV
jgi:hypothetical protein